MVEWEKMLAVRGRGEMRRGERGLGSEDLLFKERD